ncbi:thioredoxin [Allocoprobacillus halotolerans]|uniref:Thioredoxin n=1 Tax=Allocoprobacillus halotolerans TaxID=2944914 RepID=A0ABY5I3E8_9FIRM|nr:thioredoxin [Allocoprobacillus halotolerans]UTY38490.1 thioredoxin [Allocoprobacillus halotolerans]
MSKVLHVNSQEFQDVVAQNDLVLVDFFANWCGPCKMLAPSIDKLASEHPEAKVVKVDVDQEASLAMQFGVQSIPTLIVFKNGQAVNRQLGFVPYDTLESMLK